MTLLILLVAIAAGVANPFQFGANSELNRQLGTPLWAGAFVYASGLVGILLLLVLFRHSAPANAQISAVPWWAWLGGLISIAPTLAGLTLAQRLGAGIFTGAGVTAALAVSVAMDHFALAGFRQHSVSPGRIAGCALLIAGLWMVART
jgi:transporter family-2 protein